MAKVGNDFLSYIQVLSQYLAQFKELLSLSHVYCLGQTFSCHSMPQEFKILDADFKKLELDDGRMSNKEK